MTSESAQDFTPHSEQAAQPPPISDRRRRLSASRRREDILDAAAALYSSGQQKELTVDDVSKKAGVSRATFYRMFGGIEDLKAFVIGRVAKVFQKRMLSGFGSENIWVELTVGIREFIAITDAVRSEVLVIMEREGRGSIAEGMRSAIAAEISRRIIHAEETHLGRTAIRTWIAAAEFQIYDRLQTISQNKNLSQNQPVDSPEMITERLALLLLAVVDTHRHLTDDAFLEELYRSLDESRRAA